MEVSLPLRLAVEFDALYKRLDYNFSSTSRTPSSGTLVQEQHNIISRWDLPLLLKYRLSTFASLSPYVSGGLNTNYIVNTTEVLRAGAAFPSGPVTLSPPVKRQNPPNELKYRSAEGGVIAGGFEFRFHRIRAAPELRYTRWARENFREPFPAGKLRSNLDQAEVLFTLRFW